MQHAATGIVRKPGNGGLQFVDNVDESAVRVKAHMSRAGSGIEFGERRIIGCQGSLFWVESVDQHFVKSQVCGECKLVVRCRLDPVRMRSFLAFPIWTGAGMLHESRGLTQAAVLEHGK